MCNTYKIVKKLAEVRVIFIQNYDSELLVENYEKIEEKDLF